MRKPATDRGALAVYVTVYVTARWLLLLPVMKKQQRTTHRTNPQSELEKATEAFNIARQAALENTDPKMTEKLERNLSKARARSDRAYRAVVRHEPAMA